MKRKAVEIKYGDLYVTEYAGEDDEPIKSPIARLSQMEEADGEHIHGRLTIKIGDEKLEHLGFFGDDDVCFNDWVGHLIGISECFANSPQSRFLFWDGEQGDPAFEFRRSDDLVYISQIEPEFYYSVHDGQYSHGERAAAEWGESIVGDYAIFDSSVRAFIEQFKREVFISLGYFAEVWWKNNLRTGGKCFDF